MQAKLFQAVESWAILMAVWLCLLMAGGVQAGTEVYRLSPGDTLEISVWGDEALHRQVVVLPDGSITFPLAGRLSVQSLTSPEVEQLLMRRLEKYVPDPVVTVTVTGTAGNRVYLVGKVKAPGVYPMAGPMTVMQALSLGGGLDKFADEKKILIIRQRGENAQSFKFNYNDVASGQDLRANVILQPGDVVVVP